MKKRKQKQTVAEWIAREKKLLETQNDTLMGNAIDHVMSRYEFAAINVLQRSLHFSGQIQTLDRLAHALPELVLRRPKRRTKGKS